MSYLFLFFIVAFLFYFFVDVPGLIDRTIFYIFQSRDLGRAREILSGQMIFYGPEMTGGGHLPGALYYYLLAISQFIDWSWLSAWALQCFFTMVGCFAGVVYFSKTRNELAALIWFIAFSFAPFTANFLKLFLNVSMMIPFAVLVIIFIEKIYDKNKTKDEVVKYFYLACFFIGLGLHFHFSMICFFVSLLLLELMSPYFKLPRLGFKEWVKGTIFLIIPLIPYFIWFFAKKMNISIGAPAFYAGSSSGAPSSLIHLLTYGYSDPYLHVLIKTLLMVLPFPLIILIVLMIFEKNKFQYKHLLVTILVSFVLIVEYTLSPQAYRYTMPFYITTTFLLVHLFASYVSDEERAKKFLLFSIPIQLFLWSYIWINYIYGRSYFFFYQLAILIFIAFVLYVFHRFKRLSRNYVGSFLIFLTLSFSQHYLSQVGTFASRDWSLFMPSYANWKEIWGEIHQETGWSYKEARSKIYYIGHHLEQDPDLALEQVGQVSVPRKENQPDGFLVSNRFRTIWLRWKNVKNPERVWLKGQNIQPEIKVAIEHDDIVLGKNISDKMLIMPYWVKNEYLVPKHFHNIGQGYHISKDDLLLEDIKKVAGVKKIGNDEFIFKWNENPDQHYFCSTGALVKLDRNKNKYRFSIKVIGATLAQITPWVSPDWTQAWINPYIKIQCDNREEKLLLASSVGFLRKNSQDLSTPILQGNNSFVAPFVRNLELECAGKIKAIAIGRSGSIVEMITGVKELGAKELRVEL